MQSGSTFQSSEVVGFGVPVMILLPLQLAALVIMLFVLGRKVEGS